ncbi:pentapeptide repeat-containing protein [Paenibacillus sp. FSL W8-0919]|uniref:pentapeptide repeat-containing protein n=1 Tax=Paenibacillus sp. FSL W8-0919 TaxID=2954707 RepID=UPI004046F321
MVGDSNIRKEVLEILHRSQYNDEVIDGLDMSNLDLTFSDLSKVMADGLIAKRVILRASSLIGASFLDCNFEFADFNNCNLESIDIADCVLSKASFYKANMRYAKINISMCIETCFDEVDLSNGELIGSTLRNASFRNANLSGINAEQASFSSADLSGAVLTNGNFEQSDFRNAILEGVVWKGANLAGARFDNGVWEDIQTKI